MQTKKMKFWTVGMIAFITLWVLCAPPLSKGQQLPKLARIGFLGNSTPALEAHLVAAFRQGLREVGYEEGRNIVIEYRWAEGKYERFPALIAELIAQKVDVIVTAGTPATVAVKKATTSVPVVMVAVANPPGDGIVASLARPGGNITGVSSMALELEGKRLELLRKLSPKVSVVAVLWNSLNTSHAGGLERMRVAARALNIKLQLVEMRTSEDLEAAFATIVKQRSNGLTLLADRVFLHNRARINDLAAKHHLPGIYPYPEFPESGGLMSFGPNYEDMHRRAAIYVDKILKGANPADLPVEQPMKFQLVINEKTAKALGLTIPPELLFQTDKVIR
jgi:putative ABC transport system substrate-binding protein